MKNSGQYLFCVTLVSKLTEQAIVKNLKGPMEDALASNQHTYRPSVGATDAIL